MKLTIIAAVAKNGVIGAGGALPWHLPEDLRRFKELTLGKIILMGRKTFESILARNGKPLPERTSIVITRQADYHVPDGVEVYPCLEDAFIAHADDEIFIIGGGEIFRQTMPRAKKLYLTYIDKVVEGDTYFPPIPRDAWRVTENIEHDGYRFLTYERK